MGRLENFEKYMDAIVEGKEKVEFPLRVDSDLLDDRKAENGMTKEKAKDLLDNLVGAVEDNHENDYDAALKMGIRAIDALEKIRAEIDEYLIAEGFGTEYRADITQIIEKYAEPNSSFVITKSYDLPNGRKMTADFDENGICKITVQALDSLVDELNYYAEQEPQKDTTLKDIALELLQKYEEAETALIWEYSGDIAKSEENLDAEVAKYRELIDKYAEQEPCATIHGSTYGGVSWGGIHKPKEPMREFTEEEAKAYSKALDKIYKPTGFNVFNEPCDDVVSRQAVLDVIDDEWICNEDYDFRSLAESIEQLPPVRPQEQTGHWIRHDNGKYHWYLCSCCDAMAGSDEKMMAYKYCPNCGAKMFEPKERSDKE